MIFDTDSLEEKATAKLRPSIVVFAEDDFEARGICLKWIPVH